MSGIRDLADIPDSRFGQLKISPSLRRLEGPLGTTTIQPRTMQVLVCLLDGDGEVVTRDILFERCWSGVPVGDDNINRAIAKLRRAIDKVGPGIVEIETIPRIGYRIVDCTASQGEAATSNDHASSPDISRRWMTGALLGVGAVAVTGLGWGVLSRREHAEAARLADRAEVIMRRGYTTEVEQARALLAQSVDLDRSNARALGLLAYCHRDLAEMAAPDQVTRQIKLCEQYARLALAEDPREPAARVALATLRPEFGNWATVEDDLRAVIADHPASFFALNYLGLLLQAVGRSNESYANRQKVMAIEPNSPMVVFRHCLVSWITGRIRQADLAVDRALQVFPLHTGLWNARLYLFVYTGRALAAEAMLDDQASRPPSVGEDADRFWRPTLRAIRTGSPADRVVARDAIVDMVTKSPAWPTQAIMSLSYLGEMDALYAVADGFLLRKGPLVGSLWEAPDGPRINDQFWRRTMNLFTPACRNMRKDPRWPALCEGIGLTEYWQKRGIGPDPQLMD